MYLNTHLYYSPSKDCWFFGSAFHDASKRPEDAIFVKTYLSVLFDKKPRRCYWGSGKITDKAIWEPGGWKWVK